MKFIFLRIVIFPEVILKQLKSEGLTLSVASSSAQVR